MSDSSNGTNGSPVRICAGLKARLAFFRQEELLFERNAPEEPIGEPGAYAASFPALPSFKPDILKYALDGKPTQLGLWVRKPDDERKPIYIVFHGRSGNWTRDLKQDGGQYRLGWLNALANTGAGVIAVHSRGHGLSRLEKDTRVGESWFQRDIEKLADYIDQQKLDPGRLVIAGESLGGALATMLAVELTKRFKPPAVLGVINSFARIAEPIAHQFREKKILEPATVGFSPEDERVRAIRQAHGGYMQDRLRHTFDTEARLGKLYPGKTRIYIANAPDDPVIPSDQHDRLVQAARHGYLIVDAVRLEGDRVRADCTDAHINWSPEKLAADLQRCYEQRGKWGALRYRGNQASARL